MSIELEVNGVDYANFISANVERRLDALCNTFTFVMTRTRREALPFKTGDDCKVKLNGVKVLTGSIELMTIEYDDTSHTIQLAGRDRTGGLLDSSIDALPDLNSPISLKQIIQVVLDHIGLDISVIDNSRGARFDEAEDIIAPEAGSNAFEFVEGLARKKSVLLTSNGDGDIVITQSESNRNTNLALKNQFDSGDNNIKSASASYDNTGRYNLYIISSQLNPVALVTAGNTDPASIVSQSGRTFDRQVPSGRQLVLVSESSYGDDSSFDRSVWEANLRKARGRLYTATVDGFGIGRSLWDINQLIEINDVFADISGNMLCNTVVSTLDETGGEISQLTFVEANSYKLTLQDPAFQLMGDDFV